MTTVKVLIDIDFDTNEEIKTQFRRKRLQEETTETKEEVMGKMVQERHELDKYLARKGWTFKELTGFLNKKL